MPRLTKSQKTIITDFIVYTILLTIIGYFDDGYIANFKRFAHIFDNRILECLFLGATWALLLALLKGLFRWNIKRKIILTFRRGSPEEIDTCKKLLSNRKWKELTSEEKDTINNIIDNTAYKYS